MDITQKINAAPSLGQELVFKREFNAPRGKVFKAWTDPKQMARWWGPKGFTNPVCEMDVRVGGAINIVMRGPDGTDYPMGGAFKEIVPPEKLVFSCIVAGEKGDIVLETLTTAIFTEQGGKTTMTLTAKVIKSTPAAVHMIAGMKEGWSQSLVRLGDLMAKP